MTPPHLTRRGLLGLGVGLAAGATLPARGADPSEPLLVYAVRHAEKGEGDDPPLTEAGTARVAQLVEALRDVPLRAVYSTATRRTRDTAAPVAQGHGLEVTSYRPGPRGLLAQQSGAVLVVGHSNTVPALLRDLGADVATEELDGHDDLFLVIALRSPAAAVLLQHLHYGAITRGGAGAR